MQPSCWKHSNPECSFNSWKLGRKVCGNGKLLPRLGGAKRFWQCCQTLLYKKKQHKIWLATGLALFLWKFCQKERSIAPVRKHKSVGVCTLCWKVFAVDWRKARLAHSQVDKALCSSSCAIFANFPCWKKHANGNPPSCLLSASLLWKTKDIAKTLQDKLS